ncbi:MAG: hypothetical protein ACI90V_010755, partial [Bacillariaceae sp.]|jgi:hypothetical protein
VLLLRVKKKLEYQNVLSRQSMFSVIHSFTYFYAELTARSCSYCCFGTGTTSTVL